MPLFFFCRRIQCGWMESKFKHILFTGSQPLLKLEIGGALYKVIRQYWYIRDALVASINNSI